MWLHSLYLKDKNILYIHKLIVCLQYRTSHFLTYKTCIKHRAINRHSKDLARPYLRQHVSPLGSTLGSSNQPVKKNVGEGGESKWTEVEMKPFDVVVNNVQILDTSTLKPQYKMYYY